jgi:hypothetical protein
MFTAGPHASASSDTFNATTPARNTTGMNLIVLFSSDFVTPTFTDSLGNTWTTIYANAGGQPGQIAAYCVNPTVGAAHTFSAGTSSLSGFSPIVMISFKGATNAPLDKFSTATAPGAQATLQPGSITPSANGSALITCLTCDAASTNTANSGFSFAEDVQETATSFAITVYVQIQTVAAPINPTWTSTGAFGAGQTAGIVSFLTPQSGGGVVGGGTGGVIGE